MQHHSRSYALPPLCIGQAHHGTFGDCWIFKKNFLNLQRRYLVSPGFQDVNACPAKNAVDAILDNRCITGTKPTSAEGSAGYFRLAPLLRKHARTAHFDLSGCS